MSSLHPPKDREKAIQPNSSNTGRYSRQGVTNLVRKISKTKRNATEFNRNAAYDQSPPSLAKTKAIYESRNQYDNNFSAVPHSKKVTVDDFQTPSYTSKVFAEEASTSKKKQHFATSKRPSQELDSMASPSMRTPAAVNQQEIDGHTSTSKVGDEEWNIYYNTLKLPPIREKKNQLPRKSLEVHPGL